MFVDCFTNSDILKLLYEFLFCLKKVLEWQSWFSGPKTLFSALVSIQAFSSLWQILNVVEGRLLCLGSMSISSKEWPINSMSSAQIIVLMFTLHKIVIGTFNKFLNIHGAGPKSKQRQRNSNKFPDQGKRKGFEWNWILYSLLCPKFCYFCPGSHKMF